MALLDILKRIAKAKDQVLRRADHDSKNRADELRGPLANEMLLRNKRNFDRVLRTDTDLMQDTDLNQQASLSDGFLHFLANARNADGNLLTMTIQDGAVITAAVNEIQDIDFDAVPDSGAWKLTFSGQETSSLAYNANAAAVQSALNALSNLSAVTVAGDYTAGFTVTFAGADGGVNQPLLTASVNTLLIVATPVTINIVETLAGAPAVDTREVTNDNYHITVTIDSGVTTNLQVKTLLDASTASALISTSITTGHNSDPAILITNGKFSGGA